MRELNFPTDLKPVRGNWKTTCDIRVSNIAKQDIYHAVAEPGFVAWAILWKEKSGDIKLSFTEAVGSLTSWPPTYNFNSYDIECYLKTLVTKDNGKTWTDTGWHENFNEIWERNSDHHIRHVFELEDGKLMRNHSRCVEGITHKVHDHVYYPSKEGVTFPFGPTEPVDLHLKVALIWTSSNKGKKWEEIYLFDKGDPYLMITGIHPLRDGTIVAVGALNDSKRPNDISIWKSIIIESKDNGHTWSKPTVIVTDEDELNPKRLSSEIDFTELDDGRLMLIHRTKRGSFRQQYIERNPDGSWQPGEAFVNTEFPRTGYPYTYRTSDEIIFFYTIPNMLYSCDDGKTWGKFDIGFSYYGQLVEASPGKMLAISQKHIGDCPFPWKHDSAMMQTTFDYKRIGVLSQQDSETSNVLAQLNIGEVADFHIAMEIKVDAALGIAYQVVDENNYRFVTFNIVINDTIRPKDQPRVRQSMFVNIGKVENGKFVVLRKECVGNILPGSWFELQVSRQTSLLKVACNIACDPNWTNTYSCFNDENPAAGHIALFCSKSTGSFKNVRFSTSAKLIRNNWINKAADTAKQIKLDAGRK